MSGASCVPPATRFARSAQGHSIWDLNLICDWSDRAGGQGDVRTSVSEKVSYSLEDLT